MGGFQPSYVGIGEMLVSGDMQAEMLRRVSKMKAAAEADAPYDATDRDGDHYRDHFHVEAGVREGRTRRAFGRLENDSPVAVLVEFGSVHNPAHHTVLRSIDAARD